jgi:hypothetical protein
MDKQQAIDFVRQELSAGSTPQEITGELSRQLGAPPEAVEKFVASVIASSPPVPSPENAAPPPAEPPAESPAVIPQAAPAATPPFMETGTVLPATPRSGPIPPGRFVAAQPDLDPKLLSATQAMILAELMKGKKRSDITLLVCEQTGLGWEHAQQLVARVASSQSGKIAGRQNRLILPMAIGALIIGLLLTAASLNELLSFGLLVASGSYGTASQSPLFSAITFLLIGLGLTLGGVISLFLLRRS